MIESKAKEKWCPYMKEKVAHNPDGPPGAFFVYGERNCIGSACMMWRHRNVMIEPSTLLGMSYENIQEMARRAEYTSEDGYCGLAGK